jgi:uncharacterized damage-inducible protein DinB
MLEEHLLETWHIHVRVNLYLLEAIDPAAFAVAPPNKGRGFAQILAHIHNVRLMWLQSAAKELLEGLAKIEKGQAQDKALLHQSLAASGTAIGEMVRQRLAEGKRISGFKPHTPAFIGYLIAHEAYHHGEIGIALAEMGYKLDQKTAFGLWEWGVR